MTEVQEQKMSFDHETGDYSSIYFDKSIDSKKVNNTLNIEVHGTRNPIHSDRKMPVVYASKDRDKKQREAQQAIHTQQPTYSTVDLVKKHDAKKRDSILKMPNDQYIDDGTYEDIANFNVHQTPKKEEQVIYETVRDDFNKNEPVYAEPCEMMLWFNQMSHTIYLWFKLSEYNEILINKNNFIYLTIKIFLLF